MTKQEVNDVVDVSRVERLRGVGEKSSGKRDTWMLSTGSFNERWQELRDEFGNLVKGTGPPFEDMKKGAVGLGMGTEM